MSRVVWTETLAADVRRLLLDVLGAPARARPARPGAAVEHANSKRHAFSAADLPEESARRVRSYYARDYALLNALRVAEGRAPYPTGLPEPPAPAGARTWAGASVPEVVAAFARMAWPRGATAAAVVDAFRRPPGWVPAFSGAA